jgi:hypothetical protein
MNGFGGTATLTNVSIAGSGGSGGNQYINAPLLTTLQNPSNVSLETVNIALPVFYNNVNIGRAAINVRVLPLNPYFTDPIFSRLTSFPERTLLRLSSNTNLQILTTRLHKVSFQTIFRPATTFR